MNKTETMTRAFISPCKYFQGPGELNNLEHYTSRFGKRVLLVVGETVRRLYSDRIDSIYKGTDSKYDVVVFDSKNCEVTVNEIKNIVKKNCEENYKVVVGIGGGKVLDVAKGVAHMMNAAIIIMPTAASSDAPTSAFSVMYHEDGAYSHLWEYQHNPDIVLLDSEIIAAAPVRLLVAGMADALSTFIEVRACMESSSPSLVEGGYKRTLAGVAIARLSYDIILNEGLKAKLAAESGLLTEAVENIIEANTLLSGLGFENNGSAGAHGFHDGLTILPDCKRYLHGEIVSFGILCQLILENRELNEIERIVIFLYKLGLPITLKEIGITTNIKAKIKNVAHVMRGAYHMNNEPFMVTEDMIYSAIIGADGMGCYYKESLANDGFQFSRSQKGAEA